MQLADEHQLASIAFPSISTGAFGYPMRQAAEVAVGTLAETAPQLASITHIRLVLFDSEALDVHREALARLAHTH